MKNSQKHLRIISRPDRLPAQAQGGGDDGPMSPFQIKKTAAFDLLTLLVESLQRPSGFLPPF